MLKFEVREESKLSVIESLPPEIRRLILSALDLPQLKALVHASPTFHQQYLLDRGYIIRESLQVTLGSIIVDAYAARYSTIAKTDDISDHVAFLKPYSEHITQRCISSGDKLTEDEAIQMAIFYLRYIPQIVEHFYRYLVNNFTRIYGYAQVYDPDDVYNFAPSCRPQQEPACSSTEKMRLTRSVYRFQLLCQLAGSGREHLITRNENVMAFVENLEPWEVEELFSFYEFVRQSYEQDLEDIGWESHVVVPQLLRDVCTDRNSTRDHYVVGMMLRGLPLLHTILFNIQDRKHLVSTIRQSISSSYFLFEQRSGLLCKDYLAFRRRTRPSYRWEKQDARDQFPFRGDGEPDAPPLSWTIIWGDTYSNLYGYFIPDRMRHWGYVFWDAERLRSTNAIELLKKDWANRYGLHSDPRDYFSPKVYGVIHSLQHGLIGQCLTSARQITWYSE